MTEPQKYDSWYMEDCAAGQTFRGGPITVTAGDIIAFASQYDPQPFHVDPSAARTSAFGEHVASGWHTAALTMRMMVDALPKMPGGMIGRRIEGIDWPRPVRPDDTLSIVCEVVSVRATSNPARGLMRLKTRTVNQNSEDVMVMESLIFIPRRPQSA